MEGEILTLAHRDLLNQKLRKLDSDFIDYTFTNLYLFRDVHAYTLIKKNNFYIQGKTRDGVCYITPIDPVKETDWAELKNIMSEGNLFFPISEEQLQFFNPKQFEWHYKDLDNDYIYSSKVLAHLPGRKLSSRRNLIHQFLERYPTHETWTLTKNRGKDALQILDKWQQHSGKNSQFSDYEACKQALDLIDALQLTGCITYVDKEPVGFLLGEELNARTYAYHFAKGLVQFKGVYQYLFSHCAEIIENEYPWINLGQDIGSPEIRQSKLSYQPDRLLHKMRIRLRSASIAAQ